MAAIGRKINTEQDVAEKISTVLQNKRKRHARRRLLGRSFKFVSIISFVILTFVVIYRYKDEMSIDKLKQSFLVTEEYGGLSRLSSLSDTTARYVVLGDGLAVATTESVQYAPRHGDGFRLDVTLKKPGITGGGQAVLAFDGGGSQLISAHTSGILGQSKAGGKILTAYQNDTGYSSVIWEEQGYKSSVAAYDKYLKQLYLWHTPDYYALAASVSENGKTMAVAAVTSGEQGDISGHLLFFALDKEGFLRSVPLGNTLPVAVRAFEGGFMLVSDRNVRSFDNNGEPKGTFSLEEGVALRGFCQCKGAMFLWLENTKVSTKYSIVSLNEEAALSGKIETGRDIKSMTARDNTVALLIGDDVQMYTDMKMDKVISGRSGVTQVFLLSNLTPVLMTGQDVFIP